jgi:flagellar protein FliS
MFGIPRPGVHAYRQMSVDTDVLAASPHQLITLLFDGALRSIDTAVAQINSADIEGKGRSITKAIEIVGGGLAASLDMKKGGELAVQLASLYDFVVRQLVDANIGNDTTKLGEARKVLSQMRQNWVDMGAATTAQGVAA